ncbi:MAG TPA: hypothetical protein VLA52_02095 [Thermohalobaculum sp.]|nr:hypothetical protein [Thermohalobaculum sp.]
MGKYDPLARYLRKSGLNHVPMRFEEIEKVLGFPLPASSRRHRAWWSNNPSNNVMTHSWIDAGYRTEDVDLEQRRLVFRRADSERKGFAEERRQAAFVRESAESAKVKKGKDTLGIYGCLRGTVRYIGEVDLTLPADPDWGADETLGGGL